MHHNQIDTTRSKIEVRRYEEFSTAPNISLSFNQHGPKTDS